METRSKSNHRYRNCNGKNCIDEYDYKMNFLVRVPRSVHVTVSTINDGDVVVENMHGKVNAENINGAIKLTDLTQAATASTINGNVDVEEKRIFGSSDSFDDHIGPANVAIALYRAQLAACCRAVESWSLCCLRLDICQDLSILIGKYIWESRDLALFDVFSELEDQPTVVSSPVQKKARK